MLKKVKVGITQRVDIISNYDECRDAVDQNLIKWVVEAGYLPVPIPNNLVNLKSLAQSEFRLETWLTELNIDVLLLSGGNNIGDIPLRDLTENCLLNWAERYDIPVLGLCRGMQMMGVWSGGQLVDVEGHVGPRHVLQLIGEPTNDWPGDVNSYHNKALIKCPSSFDVLASSEDGTIEAFRHKNLSWEGWMWHPERESLFTASDVIRFKELINDEK